jgi:dipeptidyl-peptidase 4
LSHATARLLLAFVAFPLAHLSLAYLDAQVPEQPLTPQRAVTQKPLTVEAVFGHRSLIGDPPDELTWSPDGKHLTYLDGDQLIDLDPGTGKPHVFVSRDKMVPLMEGSESERDRDHRKRYGMSSYTWAPDGTHLLFDSAGRLWIYDLRNGTGVEVGFAGIGSGDDPKFSPDGKAISFVRDNSLAVIKLRDPGTPTTVVAPSSSEALLNGKVDWVYEEELETRSNCFWSPDSSRLAFLQMNETEVPQYPLEDWLPTHALVDVQRYPQPGDPNPSVRVGVVSASGGKTLWVKLPIQDGQDYIPRFGWADRRTVWIETLTRDHKHRDIYLADPETGQSNRILQLSDDKFLDDNYSVWVDDGKIVLTDWNDGHNHIYLYSFDIEHPGSAAAKLERQLTTGDFEVREVYKVDFHGKLIDFASNEGNPLEQQLWQVGFDGQRRQISSGAGSHVGNFAQNGGAYVDRQSARVEPPTMRLCEFMGKCNVFWQTRAMESYHLRAPEQLEVKARDGTTLYATLLLPEATSAASVPLIVNPYGGPEVQTVVNSWGRDLLFDELLAQHGFAVLHADNRGMAGRGRAFQQAAWRNFGSVQLEDQLTVLDAALAKYPQLDPKRLGWWGWSWGGSFTLYAMTHSDRFRAGIAVAPVTDWRDYDSVYTERYMSKPADFPAGYKDFSVVNSVASLKGHLLLAVGTGDDNVHIENTVQLVQKLIQADIPYDLQIYPGKMHSIAGSDERTHLFKRILAQFDQYLMPPVAQ